MNYKKVLCIAGSENLGCAGVQADIKAVSACGAFGAGAVTCLVNKDSIHVKGVQPLPVGWVVQAVRLFLDDPKAEAVKTGMLFTRGLIEALAELFKEYPDIPKVVDPVMVSYGGDRLIEWDAVEAYRNVLFPLATIITPNYREACLLLGHDFGTQSVEDDMAVLCRAGNACIVKSFRKDGKHMDVLGLPSAEGLRIRFFEKDYIDTRNVEGSGCSFSSSMAAYLAQGYGLEEAVERAEVYIHKAIEKGSAYTFGAGFGPVCHF